MPNKASNVSQGKPAVAGAVFIGPSGAALPTDAAGELSAEYKCLGYVSQDGVTNSNSITTEETKAWGGDIVSNSLTEKRDTWKLKLIEALNTEVLKAVYGDANVTGDLGTGITVQAKAEQPKEHPWVIDMIMKGNTMKRVVIPAGTIISIEDIVYNDSDPVAYGVEVSTVPVDGNTHLEYIKKGA